MDLCTDALDNYGFGTGGVNNEWFFGQCTAEDFWVNNCQLIYIVAHYDNECTVVDLFCIRLLSVTYSSMIPFLIFSIFHFCARVCVCWGGGEALEGGDWSI